MLRPITKPYFSSYERSLFYVPLITCKNGQTLFFMPAFFGSTNLIFHTTSVPLTQLRSHASTLRAHKPYFSYNFFERIPRPVDPGSFSCKCFLGPQTLFLISRPVDPASLSCKHHSGPQTLFFVPFFRAHATSHQPRFVLMQVSFGPTNLIFHKIFSSACHVPSTQVCSHASILRATNLISYQLFEFMLHPVDLTSFSYKYPLAHKPYFSYQLIEFMLRPVDPTLL